MKVIAYHLPQFHRTRENDEWWGDGFTEWTNTRKAKPLWRGHHQPRQPLDDRFYDLTDPATRQWQADLARKHGIGGFCYYHYWFGGRRLLEAPIEGILASGEPDFPFCIAWANQSWTRTWTGDERQLLMAQTYGDEPEWRAHYECVRRMFLDRRYIRVNGKPMMLIYQAQEIPNVEAMLSRWREWAVADGLGGLYLVAMLTIYVDAQNIPRGFDALQQFEPLNTIRFHLDRVSWFARNARNRLRTWFGPRVALMDRYDYDRVWQSLLRREPLAAGVPVIPGAFVDWDNTARRGVNALVLDGATPEKFRRYFAAQLRRARDVYKSDLIFVNAWNEWAEGTYLEPDGVHGTAYLEAVADALGSLERDSEPMTR